MDGRSRVNRAARLAIGLVFAGVPGCAAPGTNWIDLEMSTVASDYQPHAYPIQIPVRFENKSDRDVFLSGCTMVPCAAVEQWKEYAWFEVSTINCFCLALFIQKTVGIGPGDSLDFLVSIATDGRFRVRVQPNIGEGDRVRVYSNEFLVGSEQTSRK